MAKKIKKGPERPFNQKMEKNQNTQKFDFSKIGGTIFLKQKPLDSSRQKNKFVRITFLIFGPGNPQSRISIMVNSTNWKEPHKKRISKLNFEKKYQIKKDVEFNYPLEKYKFLPSCTLK